MRLDLPQPAVEARVLAAILTSAHWLDLAADLETRDFWHWRHRHVFDAIRNVQASGEPVSVCSVADEFEAVDLERDTNISETVGPAYLGLLIVCTDRPLNDEQFLADLWQLRRIAEERTAPTEALAA